MSAAVSRGASATRVVGVVEGVTSGYSTGRALADVSRMGLAAVPLPVYVLTALAAQAGTLRMVAGCLSLCCVLAMAGALNDLSDVEADSLGAKNTRALVEGRLTRPQVRVLASLMGLGGLVATVALRQPVSLALFVAAALCAWAYSVAPLRLKARSFLGTIVLAFAYLVVPLVLGVAQTGSVPPFTQVALASFGLIVCAQGVVWHKDVPDVYSDMHTATTTPVVRHGSRQLARWSCPMVLTGAAMVVAGTGGGSLLTDVALVWLAAVTATIARSGVDPRRARSARWAMVLVAASSGVALAGL